MYLLFLDESGNETNPDDQHFIYAGLAAHENQPHWLTQRFDAVQDRHFPDKPPITFHAAHMRSGKGFWRNVAKEKRFQVLSDLIEAIGNAPPNQLTIFGAAIEKRKDLYGEQAVRTSMEEVSKRFDSFLVSKHKRQKESHRGLIIAAEGRYDQRVKTWVAKHKELGPLHNIADVPYFAAMQDTRLLQAADIVAHAIFSLYERKDASLISPIFHRIFKEGGVLTGLAHITDRPASQCPCPVCTSRVSPGQFGDWITLD